MLSCLTAGCTSEVETTGGIPEIPENPQANDPNRRSVVISLQNKLILVNGTPESRATTRDGIAEDDENRIESFDIYAFGSDKEEGPYTFQEHFAYRADAGSLPAGVQGRKGKGRNRFLRPQLQKKAVVARAGRRGHGKAAALR